MITLAAIIFTGFTMALADAVPGVSGGTVVFILGYYDRFVGSLSGLCSRSRERRKESISFLAKLGIGWAAGMTCASFMLGNLLTTEIYRVSSLFLGFVASSLPLVIYEERRSFGKIKDTIFFAGLGALAAILLCVSGVTLTGSGLSPTPGMILYLFVGGVLAISAMILPGISGSSLLMTLGLYFPVISAIVEITSFDFTHLWIPAVLGIGVIFGFLFASKGISRLLKSHRGAVVSFIVGMTAGSLLSIVKGPEMLKDPKPMLSLKTFDIVFFIIGCAAVMLLYAAKQFISAKRRGEKILEGKLNNKTCPDEIRQQGKAN
ncbi:MAG: DUF368 domain-containing protein [Eubacterium sp.]|jgi:putative membrane protein